MKQKFSALPFAFRLVLVVVMIAAFLCLVYLCFEGYLLDYINRGEHLAAYLNENGYTKELGLTSFGYEDIQDKFGSPNHREVKLSLDNPNVNFIMDEYPGFVAHYTSSKHSNAVTTYYTYLITITNDDCHFGWLRIGIGSPRFLVRIAFLLDGKISAKELALSAKDYPDVDEGFYGEDWSRILFCYADNGVVESMAYEPPAFY